MRIVQLIPDLAPGGAERVAIDLADALAAAGHEPTLLLLRAEGLLLEEARARHRVDVLDVARLRALPAALVPWLRAARPDLLVAHMWPLTLLAPWAARRVAPRPRVLTVEHAMLSRQYGGRPLLRAGLAAAARLADRAAAVSAGAAADLARLAGLGQGAVAVLPNPVPVRPAPPPAAVAAADALWGAPRGGRLLTVGRMKAEKNHALLVDALALLRDAAPVQLMIVGEGPLRAAIEARARALGIADRLRLAGAQAAPGAFYATADAFCLSSDHEGFGNVLVEAMQHGLAIVSTDCPAGPREILDHGRFGRLVRPGDAAALADGIRDALGCTPDRAALRARAADYAPDRAAARYLALAGTAAA